CRTTVSSTPWLYNVKCDTHSRESFHHLTTLLGLTLYVDFPDNPGDCHKNDPQNAHPAKAEGNWRSPFEQIAAIEIRNIEQRLLMAVYLFDHPGGDCKAPVVMLTTTPPEACAFWPAAGTRGG